MSKNTTFFITAIFTTLPIDSIISTNISYVCQYRFHPYIHFPSHAKISKGQNYHIYKLLKFNTPPISISTIATNSSNFVVIPENVSALYKPARSHCIIQIFQNSCFHPVSSIHLQSARPHKSKLIISIYTNMQHIE
jgi:hypothetical protein